MREYEKQPRSGSNGVQLIALLALGFVVTLGVMIGTRMSSDAIAILVGVIAGVVASIPTALLLTAVTRRREPRVQMGRYQEPRRAAPPVIVVTAGNVPQGQLPYGTSYGYPAPQPRAQRQFHVMGLDQEDEQPVEAEIEGDWYR